MGPSQSQIEDTRQWVKKTLYFNVFLTTILAGIVFGCSIYFFISSFFHNPIQSGYWWIHDITFWLLAECGCLYYAISSIALYNIFSEQINSKTYVNDQRSHYMFGWYMILMGGIIPLVCGVIFLWQNYQYNRNETVDIIKQSTLKKLLKINTMIITLFSILIIIIFALDIANNESRLFRDISLSKQNKITTIVICACQIVFIWLIKILFSSKHYRMAGFISFISLNPLSILVAIMSLNYLRLHIDTLPIEHKIAVTRAEMLEGKKMARALLDKLSLEIEKDNQLLIAEAQKHHGNTFLDKVYNFFRKLFNANLNNSGDISESSEYNYQNIDDEELESYNYQKQEEILLEDEDKGEEERVDGESDDDTIIKEEGAQGSTESMGLFGKRKNTDTDKDKKKFGFFSKHKKYTPEPVEPEFTKRAEINAEKSHNAATNLDNEINEKLTDIHDTIVNTISESKIDSEEQEGKKPGFLTRLLHLNKPGVIERITPIDIDGDGIHDAVIKDVVVNKIDGVEHTVTTSHDGVPVANLLQRLDEHIDSYVPNDQYAANRTTQNNHIEDNVVLSDKGGKTVKKKSMKLAEGIYQTVITANNLDENEKGILDPGQSKLEKVGKKDLSNSKPTTRKYSSRDKTPFHYSIKEQTVAEKIKTTEGVSIPHHHTTQHVQHYEQTYNSGNINPLLSNDDTDLIDNPDYRKLCYLLEKQILTADEFEKEKIRLLRSIGR